MAGKREDHCISTSLHVSVSGFYLCREHPLLKDRRRSKGSQSLQLQSAHCWELQLGCSVSPPTSPSTGKELWSHTSGSTPPASRSASPSAFCFTRLDVLLTSYNATICSSLSICKRQQFPSVRGAGLPLSKLEGGYRQSTCNYMNTSLFYPLEYLKFLAT